MKAHIQINGVIAELIDTMVDEVVELASKELASYLQDCGAKGYRMAVAANMLHIDPYHRLTEEECNYITAIAVRRLRNG